MHHVTCIIGVSVRNRPRLGIIHKPYSTYPYPGCERTYIGIPEAGLFTLDTFTDNSGQISVSKPSYLPPFEENNALSIRNF